MPVWPRFSLLAFASAAPLVLGSACSGDSPPPSFALAADVEVRRDERGVPHLSAHDLPDLLFALGYVTAQDRLFQLDVNRRRALGRMAELFGQKSLADDQLARTLGFGALGEADEQELATHDPDVHHALDAYAAGINAFLAAAAAGREDAAWPPEYADLDPAYRPEPWRAADTLAVLKAELFLLAVHPETDVLSYAIMAESQDGPSIYRDLYRPEPLENVYVTAGFPKCAALAGSSAAGSSAATVAGAPLVGDPAAVPALLRGVDAWTRFSRRRRVGPTGASNNWALCGQRTRSGAAMLANDPHLDVDLPANLYEFHIESDDSVGAPGAGIRIAGFGIPGAPAALLGHNGAAAWGVTTVEADIADTYLEALDGDTVLFRGQRVPLLTHNEKIRVRRDAGTVADFDEIEQVVRVVPHHGPLFSDALPDLQLLLGNKGLSVKWLGFGVTHESRAFYDLARVRSFPEFKSALDHFEAGLLNFIYAGVDGDIGYYPHASYPLRARLDANNPPYGVLPGDGSYEWTGQLVPNDCIPQLYAPPSCLLFTANNDPAGTTADGDALNDAFYLGGTFDYGLRARRIRDRFDALAAAGTGAMAEDFESIQRDVHNGVADHFLPLLLSAADKQAPTDAAKALVAILRAWDRQDTVAAVAPTLFYAWYSQLLVDVFSPNMPLTFARAATDDRLFAHVLQKILVGGKAPSGFDYLAGKAPDDVMIGALEKVAVALPKKLGPDATTWTWGTAHTITFNHPLAGGYDIGPLPLAGGLSSINAARFAPTSEGDPVIRPDVFEAPNARIVVELLPGHVTMHTAMPTGDSGVPGPHYQDRLPGWLSGTTTTAPFERDEVLSRAPVATVLPAGLSATLRR